jgi:hypothetical protein
VVRGRDRKSLSGHRHGNQALKEKKSAVNLSRPVVEAGEALYHGQSILSGKGLIHISGLFTTALQEFIVGQIRAVLRQGIYRDTPSGTNMRGAI